VKTSKHKEIKYLRVIIKIYIGREYEAT